MLAPLAVNVVVAPTQIVEEEGVMVRLGKAFTVTVLVIVAGH